MATGNSVTASNSGPVTVRRALISVSDKTGVVDFARFLVSQGIELLSTGGTCRLLREQGIGLTEVSDFTGFPEMMDGRVKTLHPKIHGGVLGRRGVDDAVMQQHGIQPIDLVVVNLYPFAETIARPDCALPDAIEQIDIGGPTLLRAAAKNHRDVAVVVHHTDYARILDELARHQGALTYETRFDLAVKAFEHTAAYDGAVANYLGQHLNKVHHAGVTSADSDFDPFPRTLNLQLLHRQTMRYGENPHQRAALYVESGVSTAPSVVSAKQLQGKALSFNNVADADAALECVCQFGEPACVIVKHGNPCGVALAENAHMAYQQAYQTDSESAFGGIIAFNCCLDGETARSIIANQFVEVIIAPEISASARDTLAAKESVRVLECGAFTHVDARIRHWDYKRVTGGLLVQDRDFGAVDRDDLKIVSKRLPTASETDDMLFAWRVAKYVKSNAIVYAKNRQTVGIGAGQMSRVNSARIAIMKAEKAGLPVAGAVMASDAFFPFRDGIDSAAQAGIACVIQPGGSVRDAEVIAAADEHGMVMAFTGMRHFRH